MRGCESLATSSLRDPVTFWGKLDKLPVVTEKPAPEVIAALERWLPEKGLPYKLVHRIAGLGSLGRQRFVAMADWRGGLIAREAKALAISAYLWEQQSQKRRDSVPKDSRHLSARARPLGASQRLVDRPPSGP